MSTTIFSNGIDLNQNEAAIDQSKFIEFSAVNLTSNIKILSKQKQTQSFCKGRTAHFILYKINKCHKNGLLER